jgi:KamA family protein
MPMQIPSASVRTPTIARTKFISYDNERLHLVPHLENLSPKARDGLLRASAVFPVKLNNYVLDNLIDWSSVPNDPMFRLLFPQPDMLSDEMDAALSTLEASSLSEEERLRALVRIRDTMNPHSSSQVSNIPDLDGIPVEGVQHKYQETVLFFPKQSQTCHAYCTFCFRWPQFVETSAPKFEAIGLDHLRSYLRAHSEVSDVLVTGGDPMVMSARRIGALVDLLLEPELHHVSTLRFGTKALSFWPQRFFGDHDSEALLAHFRRLSDGGKHLAIMLHVNHWREMAPEPFEQAVEALRHSGAILRSQAPVLAGINDDPDVWARMWRRQIELGIIPYYLFVERDTGATQYFSVPLVRVHSVYMGAVEQVSGLARTARGPVMSTSAGKVQVLGPISVGKQTALALVMLQSRIPNKVHRPFLAQYCEEATWIDQLKPFDPKDPFPF